jgi:hypothetical protein
LSQFQVMICLLQSFCRKFDGGATLFASWDNGTCRQRGSSGYGCYLRATCLALAQRGKPTR